MGNAPPSRSNLNVFQLINAEILEKTFISHFSIVQKNIFFSYILRNSLTIYGS